MALRHRDILSLQVVTRLLSLQDKPKGVLSQMAGTPLLALCKKQDDGQSMAMNSSAAAHVGALGAKRGASKQAHAADPHAVHMSASEVPPCPCRPNPILGKSAYE